MNFWWNDYVGVPYEQKGRTKQGADCWGLVRMIYQEQFDIELPSFGDEYQADEAMQINDLLAMHREGWEKVTVPRPGDVVLFRIFGHLGHVGVVATPNTFLHCREGYAATIERLDTGTWRHRIEGFYRYSERGTAGDVEIAAMPHPLRTDRIDGMMPAGMSVREIVDEIHKHSGVNAGFNIRPIIMIDGQVVPAEKWDMVPANGTRVEYRAVAAGGGLLRIIGALAVVVAAAIIAPYLAPLIAPVFGGAATAVATGALTIAGTLMLNAIFPIRPPDTKSESSSAAQRQNLLQGGQNQGAPYSAIPVVLGQFRYAAPLGATNYVESSPTTSYLRQILVWGYGPLSVEDLRVGDTSINTLDEVEYQTLNGYSSEDLTNFNKLYGLDVDQQYVNIKMECIVRAVTSATRTSNVVTVVTAEAHGYSNNWVASLSGVGSGFLTVINSTTFSFPHAGADGPLTTTSVSGSPFTERVIDEECDRIRVEIHFPEGLRMMATDTSIAGKSYPTPFRAVIQTRQLDSDTLAPLTGWGDIQSRVSEYRFSLSAVVPVGQTFLGSNSTTAYRWTRISVDRFGKVIMRTGCPTNNKFADPTGTFLDRLKSGTYGLITTFSYLPDLGDGEEEVWRVLYDNVGFDSVVDYRVMSPSAVTGLDLTRTSNNFVMSAGTIARAQIDAVVLGNYGEAYANRKDAFTYVVGIDVPKGRHEVRVRRTWDSAKETTIGSANAIRYHDSYLLSITGYSNNRPVQPPKPLCMTALRVKATNQINGTLDGVTATVTSICKDWNRPNSTWITRATRNPASLFRYILQHPANAQAVADSSIDLTTIQDWHEYCEDNEFIFDMVILEQRSLIEVLRDVCAAGRASPTMRDGKWTVVVDEPRTVVAQYFTPHNSWGFEGVRALPVMPHGFRVQFNNSDRAFQADEMIVYNDGYNDANATILEGLTLPGVTTTDAIYKHARFHLAQIKLRPETYTLNADIEHLICTRGDLVKVSHDVPLWGIGSGRISSQITSTQLKLDEAMPMVAGTQYTIRIRLENGTSVTRTVAAKALDGYYDTIDVTASLTATEAAQGNLFMFGSLSSETVDLIVQSIEPSENMTARLTLVDYAPAVYDSDLGPIPAFNSQITKPQQIQQDRITQAPIITSSVSDESVLQVIGPGKYITRIKTSYRNPAVLPLTVRFVQGQIRASQDKASEWRTIPYVQLQAGCVYFDDVDEGTDYDIRLRYVGENTVVGPWATQLAHRVIGKTTKPSAVTSLFAKIEGTMVRLDWADNPEPDVSLYEVRTTDANWGGTGFAFKGAASTCLVPPGAMNTTVTWYIRAIDDLGLYSNSSQTSFTLTPPANPASLTETFYDTSLTTATVTLDWPDVLPSGGLRHYEVTYGSVVKTVSASTITLPADWVGNRVFTVKTVDNFGNKSSGISKTVAKLVPGPVTNLKASVIDNNATLSWTPPVKTTLPIQGYRIKRGSSFSSGTDLGTTSASSIIISEKAAGTYTYWVATFDTDNNLSTAVSITAKVAKPPDFQFFGTTSSTFSGTTTSAKVT